jgi:hypothetical protein
LVKITNSLHLLPLEMESVFPLFEVLWLTSTTMPQKVGKEIWSSCWRDRHLRQKPWRMPDNKVWGEANQSLATQSHPWGDRRVSGIISHPLGELLVNQVSQHHVEQSWCSHQALSSCRIMSKLTVDILRQ